MRASLAPVAPLATGIGMLELRRVRCEQPLADHLALRVGIRRVLVCCHGVSAVPLALVDSQLPLAVAHVDHGYVSWLERHKCNIQTTDV